MKAFDKVKAGDKLIDHDGQTYDVICTNYYGCGDDTMCLASDRSIWPMSEFSAADFEKL